MKALCIGIYIFSRAPIVNQVTVYVSHSLHTSTSHCGYVSVFAAVLGPAPGFWFSGRKPALPLVPMYL